MTVGIEAVVLVAVSTLVSYEHLWVCVVEMTPVVVGVHCERPATSMPSHRTIEMCQSDVLVVLLGVQHIAEVSIAAVPPDAKHVGVSVQTH